MSDTKKRTRICTSRAESRCQEPYTYNDGVPYCDACGLYRWSIHMKKQTDEMNAKRRKPSKRSR